MGEIFLVVIGILIALQINNWNQGRQKRVIFENSLEQLYNSIKVDTESLLFGIEYTRDQILLIDQLLEDPSTFSDEVLPFVLFYLEQDFDIEHHNRETSYLIGALEYDAQDVSQRELAKELTSYASFHSATHRGAGMRLTSLLESRHLPNPNSSFGFSSYDDFVEDASVFYSKGDLLKIRRIAESNEARSILISLRAEKAFLVDVVYNTLLNDGLSMLQVIKAHNPDVRLMYSNVGILGTALPTGWDKSVPLELVDEEKSIWELKAYLNDGMVKFRTRDSWVTNWGGKEFPKGKTIYFGDNINVKKGWYHIRINLSENEYEFKELKTR